MEIKKKLKSNKNSIKFVEPMLLELRSKFAVPDEKFYNMVIAMTEAVNNAIIHGNKCDEEKSVQISITVKDNKIHILIKDEGNGFNPDMVGDPRAPENLLKESGRGVFLMNELTESFSYEFTDSGTAVTMVFCL